MPQSSNTIIDISSETKDPYSKQMANEEQQKSKDKNDEEPIFL